MKKSKHYGTCEKIHRNAITENQTLLRSANKLWLQQHQLQKPNIIDQNTTSN